MIGPPEATRPAQIIIMNATPGYPSECREVAAAVARGNDSSTCNCNLDEIDTSTSTADGEGPSLSLPSYAGNSALDLDADDDAHQGGMVQYFHVNNNSEHNDGKHDYFLGDSSEFETSNSHDVSSPVMGHDDHCADEESEEGLLFEDSSYVDEITRWMDDQRPIQQQAQFLTDGVGHEDQHEGTSLLDSDLLSEPSNAYARDSSTGEQLFNSKRNASQISDSPSSQKLSVKRRHRSFSATQSASPDSRSPSRIRMDDALQERSQSQVALRDALYALERAKAVVRECRTRFNTAKHLVECTAKEEFESLLREDVPWNDMFRRLKEYKEVTGDCNVKQNVSRDDAGDENNSSDMMRRLSAWVGKNRKEHKQRRCTFRSSKRVHEHGKTNEENVNTQSTSMVVINVGDDTANSEDDDDVFDDVDPDSIHADPYKRVALDSINFDWDPRNSRWNNMYEELRRYKEGHGAFDSLSTHLVGSAYTSCSHSHLSYR